MKNKTKQRILYFCICLLFLAEACISSAKVYYSAVILDKAQAGDLSGMLFSIFLAVSACLGLFLVDYLNTRSKLAYMTSIDWRSSTISSTPRCTGPCRPSGKRTMPIILTS